MFIHARTLEPYLLNCSPTKILRDIVSHFLEKSVG